MTFQRHIFGSRHGYGTLARSPGVTADDCRLIETCAYGFGQTYDAGYYAALAEEPTFLTLPLSGASRGFARVFPGGQDDRGRPTLRFITAILSRRDWDAVLLGDLAQLTHLAALWEWDGQSDLPALELPGPVPRTRISRGRVREVLCLISAIERIWTTGGRLIVSTADFSAEDFRAVEMLLPPATRMRFSSAYRVLSPAMPTTLVGLAEEVEGSAAIYRPGADETGYSPYALALQAAGLASGIIPLPTVIQYTTFGAASQETPAATLPPAPAQPPPAPIAQTSSAPKPAPAASPAPWLWPAIAAGILGLAIGFAAGWLVSARYSEKVPLPAGKPPQQQPTSLRAAPELVRLGRGLL